MTAFDRMINILKAQLCEKELYIKQVHHCGDKELRILTPLIMNHPYLTELNFSQTLITEAGLDAFLATIQKRKLKLTGLAFFDNRHCFGTAGISALISFVASYPHLESFVLKQPIEENALLELISHLDKPYDLKKFSLSTPVSERVLEAVLDIVESKNLYFEFSVVPSEHLSDNSKSLLERIKIAAEKNHEAKLLPKQKNHHASSNSRQHLSKATSTHANAVALKSTKKKSPREEALDRRKEQEDEESLAYYLEEEEYFEILACDDYEPPAAEDAVEKEEPAPLPQKAERPPAFTRVHQADTNFQLSDHGHIQQTFGLSDFQKAYYRIRYAGIAESAVNAYDALTKIMQDYIDYTIPTPCDFIRKSRRRWTTNATLLVNDLRDLCESPPSIYKDDAIKSFLSRQRLTAQKSTHACLVFTLEYLLEQIDLIKSAPVDHEQFAEISDEERRSDNNQI